MNELTGTTALTLPPAQGSEWRRTSFVAIAKHAHHGVMSVLKSYMELGGLAVLVFSLTRNLVLTFGILAIGVLSVIVFQAIGAYWFLKFKVTSEHIEILTGIFNRKHLNIPFEKIQQVSTEQPFYYKIMGDYLDVHLDTAGSKKTEALIPALSLDDAHQLQALINAKVISRTTDVSTDAVSPSPEPELKILLGQNSASLLLYGILQNKLIWFALILFGFFEKIKAIVPKLDQKYPAVMAKIENVLPTHLSGDTGYAIVLVLVFLSVFFLFSAIHAWFTHFGYVLYKSKDGYISIEGLLTRVETRVTIRKIQWMMVRSNLAEQLIGRQNVVIQQFGSVMTVPCVTDAQKMALIRDVMPHSEYRTDRYKRISVRYVTSKWLMFTLPLFLWLFEFCSIDEINANIQILIRFTGFMCGMSALLPLLFWYRYGFSEDAQHYYVKNGLFVSRHFIIEKHKLQATSFHQTWMMKRNQLCSVTLYFSNGNIKLPYLLVKDGNRLIDSGFSEVSKTGENWT